MFFKKWKTALLILKELWGKKIRSKNQYATFNLIWISISFTTSIYLYAISWKTRTEKRKKKSYEYITAIKSFFTKYKKLPFLKIKYFFAAFVSPELTRETGESKLIKQSPPPPLFLLITGEMRRKDIAKLFSPCPNPSI